MQIGHTAFRNPPLDPFATVEISAPTIVGDEYTFPVQVKRGGQNATGYYTLEVWLSTTPAGMPILNAGGEPLVFLAGVLLQETLTFAGNALLVSTTDAGALSVMLEVITPGTYYLNVSLPGQPIAISDPVVKE